MRTHKRALDEPQNSKASRDKRLKLLIAASVLVWTAAFAASTYKIKLSAKNSIVIALTTDPRIVRLTVNGERYQDGAYLETPIKLELTPGQHRLKISREGYIAHVVTVRGGAGESYRMDDVVMQKNPELAFASVSVSADPVSQNQASLYVEIDDGLVRGPLPLDTRDLQFGAEHVLTVYPNWPAKDPRSRCRFTVTTDDGHEITVGIAKSGKTKVRGCEPLSKKRR